MTSLRRLISWYSANSVPLISGAHNNARTTVHLYIYACNSEVISQRIAAPPSILLFLSQSWKMHAICLSCQYVNLSVGFTIYQGSTLIHQKVAIPTEGQGSPILSFITLEQFNAIRLVQVCEIIRAFTNMFATCLHNFRNQWYSCITLLLISYIHTTFC